MIDAASPSSEPPPPATSTSGTTLTWPSLISFATATIAVARWPSASTCAL